jgi:ubiquitin carboxyl-terminal hydrolase 36/42
VTFFSPSGVVVGYRQIRSAGAGMFNVGNTCYLNSTLQALFHTPALYNYLMANNAHASRCCGGQGNGFMQVSIFRYF